MLCIFCGWAEPSQPVMDTSGRMLGCVKARVSCTGFGFYGFFDPALQRCRMHYMALEDGDALKRPVPLLIPVEGLEDCLYCYPGPSAVDQLSRQYHITREFHRHAFTFARVS
jgi:hypothetical protein